MNSRIAGAACFMAAVVLLLLGLLVSAEGCAELVKAHDVAKPIVAATCTTVEVVTRDEIVHGICAADEELEALVDVVRAARVDSGGPRFAASCVYIPKTLTCATPAELARAIDVVKARRKDGGP